MHAYIIPSAIQKCIRGSCAAFKWGRIVLPLIGTTFSNCSSLWHTLSTQNTLTTTTASICAWFTPYCSLTSLPTSGSQSKPTASSSPSQLIIIMIALAATTVLLLVVGLVAMVTVVRRRQSKEHVYENNNTDRSVRVQTRSNSLQSTSYYEPMSLNIGPSHPHHQPHPLCILHINTTNTGDDITMEDCPAYQSMDIHTSGEQTYI